MACHEYFPAWLSSGQVPNASGKATIQQYRCSHRKYSQALNRFFVECHNYKSGRVNIKFSKFYW